MKDGNGIWMFKNPVKPNRKENGERMAVKGKYTLIEPGNVRFEIFQQGSPSEIVNGTFSLQGDVLTFTSADGKEIERYKREK
jgi:hypothetical protein